MRIATWNVNSVRARLPVVTGWLADAKPDVAVFQEIKCEEAQFPRAAFEELGYHVVVVGQKSYNGVALLSREPPEDVVTALAGDPDDDHARYVAARIRGVRIAGLYLPNGNPVGTDKYPRKLAWMARLKDEMAQALADEDVAVWAGDYNVIPEDRDVYSPADWREDALFRLETRRAYRTMLNLGLTDAFRAVNGNVRAYTFWDYQAGRWPRDEGLRIDHALLSPKAADRLVGCRIERAPRAADKASDHTPLVVELAAAPRFLT